MSDYEIILKPSKSNSLAVGWGNGYVALPPSHPYYDKPYEEIPVDVHGGLTYGKMATQLHFPSIPSNHYIVGFDTAHFGDSTSYWTRERVLEEAQSLQQQLKDLA